MNIWQLLALVVASALIEGALVAAVLGHVQPAIALAALGGLLGTGALWSTARRSRTRGRYEHRFVLRS